MTDVQLRDTEWELLQALWELDAPTAREVCDHLAERRGWTYSTVKTLLDRMVKRGVATQERDGRQWRYAAAVAPEEARRSIWRRFVDLTFGGSVRPALRFVAEDAELTDAQREELLELLKGEDP